MGLFGPKRLIKIKCPRCDGNGSTWKSAGGVFAQPGTQTRGRFVTCSQCNGKKRIKIPNPKWQPR
jgi:DnaJ-class molecular chaperone